ncbi:CRISPR-associated helicase/endonuclease Cas3 [Trinickia caryophylli]|uniref:CRISPR-associated endonuclease/helicase Cas3 n=1 Tax=Trinickia caryophylli TaxID=28094 RepID=A0A1X7FSE6_TRICW|nr:CRISPR-associated helicase/endonuclease Cas3 [Trinickia caryophylli]PMS11961.1 CRISPR-associated helicase Cas3' [Trinickia caryophylli]TRX13960.1 CRISPR-associated helicase/endonuclease Cas3 [Trinickia caryophylli]WQE15557.1 CRISPR-associated helicase/endonuclease Cas3 [Trinickia caryophylli]SMF57887.1 CRISPR-associated endonuclease/helicase Cas3 [Trinickia caryophylli]GLU33691.1 CRISPR-associated helicase/endonuclease Cas3 [Trinickia caryophylli]
MQAYWRYRGKASPRDEAGDRWHLLPFHMLDVAAMMEVLLDQRPDWVEISAASAGWSVRQFRAAATYFAILHDLGKFARSFQAALPLGTAELVSTDKAPRYTERHDTLGFLLWMDYLQPRLPQEVLPAAEHSLWESWIRIACGHHGRPPREGGAKRLYADDHFLPEDMAVAKAFACDAAVLLDPLPSPASDLDSRIGWQLAGLMVLADWLGSDQHHFPYRATPMALPTYWHDHARPAARRALVASGLTGCRGAPYAGSNRLVDFIPHLTAPTPLQCYAANVPLVDGPQLFMLEDVTGSGKTEAALILTHRLMAAGLANGLYFALPTMATSNQMYRRVGSVYRRLFSEGEQPSLVLAHSARRLVADFALSVQRGGQLYSKGDASASMSCNAWLADSNKKALLAQVGVGSIDQALLAVLPVRHQSLRLFGLAGKVLIVDEVHGFDPYVRTLLGRLLRMHAAHGGSAVLLSATVPEGVKAELLNAYRQGLRQPAVAAQALSDYPLASQLSAAHFHQEPCETRRDVKRRVRVVHLSDEVEVVGLIASQAQAGRCVCWVRNTVDDARRAFGLLREKLPPETLYLFHSRYAMGHRLDIEERVLTAFGKHSHAAARAGRVLIGTQVLEQSLDFDVDAMVSDLAPIDLLIQRAGRLQRHARQANGDPWPDATGAEQRVEQRPEPVLYVYGPAPDDDAKADWYGRVFSGAQYVYPDFAVLWRTQQTLLAAGHIVSPGAVGELGAVRQLVEAVYGVAGEREAPAALMAAADKCLGEAMSERSMALFNALQLEKGYCEASSKHWVEETDIATRLGDETRLVYLVEQVGDALRPLCHADDPSAQWELSALRVDEKKLKAVSPAWRRRFEAQLKNLELEQPWLSEYCIVVPLIAGESVGEWLGQGVDARDREVQIHYSLGQGLLLK